MESVDEETPAESDSDASQEASTSTGFCSRSIVNQSGRRLSNTPAAIKKRRLREAKKEAAARKIEEDDASDSGSGPGSLQAPGGSSLSDWRVYDIGPSDTPAATQKRQYREKKRAATSSTTLQGVAETQKFPTSTDPIPLKRHKPIDIGKMEKVCKYCGALYFPRETYKCCAEGKVSSLANQVLAGLPYAHPQAASPSRPSHRTHTGCTQVPSQRRLLQQLCGDVLKAIHS